MDRFASTSNYATTIFRTIAVPDDWPEKPGPEQAPILWHEMVHLKQARRLGFGNDFLGWLILGFLYLFILPVVFTFRSRFEREAYGEHIKVLFIVNKGNCPKMSWQKLMVEVFTGKTYLWMWPFKKKVREWANESWFEAKQEYQTHGASLLD